MRRTQIYLDEAQHEALRTLAHRRGTTLAAVIREILDSHLGLSAAGAADPLDRVIGLARGDGTAVAEHADDYLYGKEPVGKLGRINRRR